MILFNDLIMDRLRRTKTVKIDRALMGVLHARWAFTLYLSVPCWSCLSSLSSTVKCRVMHSMRACRPRYSLYSALKSFLYLWRCSGELITEYFLLGTLRGCERLVGQYSGHDEQSVPIPSSAPAWQSSYDTHDKYSAASGDDEETPLLLSHVPFKPETSSTRKLARISVSKEKQKLQLHLHRWLQLTTYTHLIHGVKVSVRSACLDVTLPSGSLLRVVSHRQRGCLKQHPLWVMTKQRPSTHEELLLLCPCAETLP